MASPATVSYLLTCCEDILDEITKSFFLRKKIGPKAVKEGMAIALRRHTGGFAYQNYMHVDAIEMRRTC